MGMSVTRQGVGDTVVSAEIVDDSIVNADINSSAGIVGTKLAAATVADAKITSPNNAVYRTVDVASSHLGSGITAGTFVMYPTTASLKSAVDVVAGVFPVIWLAGADYAVNGLTTKVRVRLIVACNATAPGTQTFTGGLYPVTVAGGSSAFVPTLGTVTAGTTAAVVNPAASTVQQVASADTTIPSDGAFCLGFTSSATTATNSFTKVTAHLQFRNV